MYSFVFSVAFISQKNGLLILIFVSSPPHQLSSLPPRLCSHQSSPLSEQIGIDQLNVGEELVWEETAIWYS